MTLASKHCTEWRLGWSLLWPPAPGISLVKAAKPVARCSSATSDDARYSALRPRKVIPPPCPHLQSFLLHRHFYFVIPSLVRSRRDIAHLILRVQLAFYFINRVLYQMILDWANVLSAARRCRLPLRMIRALILAVLFR